MCEDIFRGAIENMDIPKGGLISIQDISKLELELLNYILEYTLENRGLITEQQELEENLVNQCKEVGLESDIIPKSAKTTFSRIGHALSTFIAEKIFHLEIPIRPWAIPLATEQDLPNFDALCFDSLKGLWILEAKTSLSRRGLSNAISELIKKIKKQSIYGLFNKAMLYQHHYPESIDKILVMKSFLNLYLGERNSVRIIGFFISPDVTERIGKNFEQELEIPYEAIRRNVNYPNLLCSAIKIYRELGKIV